MLKKIDVAGILLKGNLDKGKRKEKDVVACTYNSSYLGGGGRRIMSSRLAKAKLVGTLSQK
jgi:hypothetical protein